ncbi:MAG: proton-conducting membrane transporter [Deltaproteobacteria bacterium]|nr:proton-conducting membrane transporter [Deltaproteobacteria bacterium]
MSPSPEGSAVLHWLVLAIPAAPLLIALLLGALMMLGRALREREIVFLASVGVGVSFLASIAATFVFARGDSHAIELHYGQLYALPGHVFGLELLVDRLSIAMVLTTGVVTALVTRFSIRYLHRDPGFLRFFVLLSIFDAGMQILVLAGSYDLLFIGWEMVGLSSFLLVAFFQLRNGPVRGGLRAFVTYRMTDVGLLVAGVLLHQATGSSQLEAAFGSGAWPHASTHLDASATTPIALALLLSTIGKSALFPASGWLPRAMEGPTPSSALFYGALSVHAGIYLLLRSAPLFESTPIGSVVLIVIGALTVVTSSLAGRVQSDIKGALAYATSSQVGLMALGVGVAALTRSGWLAILVVAYMVAHAFLRTLQLLRAPSALRDAQEIAAALPDVRRGAHASSHFVPERARELLHHLAYHRFFLDELLDRALVAPTLALARAADDLERRWVATLAGLPVNEQPREPRATDAARTSTSTAPAEPRDAREKVEPA